MHREVLRMDRICKAYNGRSLLDNFHMNLFAGEILGLIGLSESGKTTLLRLIAGEFQADGGRILVNDEDMRNKGSHLHRSVFMIHEQTMLILAISVAENMFVIRSHRSRKLLLNKKKVLHQAQQVLDELGIKLSAQTSAERLTVAQRHLVELAKAYIVGSRIILIDEIISAYSENELKEFLNAVKILKEKGVSFIITGYGSEQISAFADRLVFLANGKNMKTLDRKDFGSFDIKKLYFNNREDLKTKSASYIKPNVTFEIQNLLGCHLNVSFSINEGEIVGIYDTGNRAGLELYQILTGTNFDYKGKFLLNGQPFYPQSISQSLKKGVLFMPLNSTGKCVINSIRLIDNICLPVYQKMSVMGYIKKDMLKFVISQYSQALNINEKKFTEDCNTLDFYLRQKLYLSRIELARPKVLFCVNPYARADAITREQLDSFFEQIAKKGTAVGIIAASLKSIYDICDSVITLDDLEGAEKRPKTEIKVI